MAFSTCSLSVVRIRFLQLNEDFTWANVEAAGWSVGELCSGITCACLPTFRPLLSRAFPGLSSRLHGDKYHRNNTSDSSTVRSPDVEKGPQRPPKVHHFNSSESLFSAAGSTKLKKGVSFRDVDRKKAPPRPERSPMVETHIAAGIRTVGGENKDAPIRVKYDIVQTEQMTGDRR